MPREWLVRIEGGSSEQSPARGVIPKFYPIAQRGCGATETDLEARTFCFRAASFEEVTLRQQLILRRESDQSPRGQLG